jgi:hypothetical protein
MNKQEILRHLSGFCQDIEVDCKRFVYTDQIYVCGLEIEDDAITVFYPHRRKERCDRYTGINNYQDIIDIWTEYRLKLDKVKQKLNPVLI